VSAAEELGGEKKFAGWLTGFLVVVALTVAAIAITGFHSGMEDDSIYLPGIKKLVNPALYPRDGQFFTSQTNAFLLLRMVAASVRVTHLPVQAMQLVWQVLSILALVGGFWIIAHRCFRDFWDRVGATALVSALLTMPVAGTALYIADQHLHPRTPATAAILFAIGAVLGRRYWLAVLCSVAAVLLHPLMGAFGIVYLIVLALPLERWNPRFAVLLASLPLPIILHPNAAWREAAGTRDYIFLQRWEWYEWLGIFAPMVLVWWFGMVGEKMGSPALARLCKRLVLYSVLMTAAGLIVGLPERLVWLAPLQPMRHLQLVYALMLLSGGGLLTHYVLQKRAWRWAVLFVPLCGGMLYAQRASFPTSAHIEWPGQKSANRWVRCFQWIKSNTPQDAYFVINPRYMARPGEEIFGFRAIAERSKLADWHQDAAVVAVTPDLAPEWKRQVDALRGYEGFTRENFLQLKKEYGITWAVVEGSGSGLTCPYQEEGLAVCRIE
jgi:hypothetical protein